MYVGVNGILSVEVIDITEKSATVISEMPCHSPDLLCALSNLILLTATNNMSVTVENTTDNGNGSVMAYSYPDHTILLSGLSSGATYSYCVIAVNDSNNEQVGTPMCGSFITRSITTENISEDNDGM